jgi:hypothetical protein
MPSDVTSNVHTKAFKDSIFLSFDDKAKVEDRAVELVVFVEASVEIRGSQKRW